MREKRREKMKKIMGLGMIMTLALSLLTGCGNGGEVTSDNANGGKETISVVSREDGSGTRGAFIELFGIEEKNAEGNKIDYTTDMAEVTNSTSVMMTTIAGNPNAIGYISLGAMNDTVKALDIDGVTPTIEHIKDGTYSIARPFHIATKGNLSEATTEFISFMMSQEGQAIVEKTGYISKGNTGVYNKKAVEGKVSVAGSSSVTPVMEKLKEAYLLVNPDATIEVQQSDSTTGMTSVMEGVCDIGMASRDLKDSETAAGLVPTVIAMDGIAMIVNTENPISALKKENVKEIFKGNIATWAEINQ